MRHTNKALTVASKHKAETKQPEQNRTETEVNEVLKQNVRRVLTTCKASLTKSKAWLHEEYQHCCQQHPYGIYRK